MNIKRNWTPRMVLMKLNAVPFGLGSNPGEDIDVCKYIVPSPQGSTLNNRRATSPLFCVWWKRKRSERAPDHTHHCVSVKSMVELNQIVQSPT
ncbi:hypothetical protein TNCV_1963111 [Trichonephila clavipes]|nr:hypothetical protein TNCV_1963111 [Trichonephila clavipes]